MIVKKSILNGAKDTRAAVMCDSVNFDNYSAGFCNGIDFVLALIEGRKPELVCPPENDRLERGMMNEEKRSNARRTLGGVISKK